MSIRTRVIMVLAGALALTTILAACTGGPTTEQIVQTAQAQNKIDNAQATRQTVIDAGGDPDAQVEIVIDSNSAAAVAVNNAAATATALAESGVVSEGIGGSAGEIAQGAAFEVLVPDGAAESGVVEVDIPALGSEGVQFVPDMVKITVGSTVRWSHDRRSASSTTSHPGQDEEWDSGDLHVGPFDKGKPIPSFEHTFTVEGCFTYFSLFSEDPGVGAVCVVAE